MKDTVEEGRARERQHSEARHALHLQYHELALTHLYESRMPPKPFNLAIVGYPLDRHKAGVTLKDGKWTFHFDRSQKYAVREINPDIDTKLPHGIVYVEGKEIPIRHLSGSMRANKLVETYAREYPEVDTWVVIEAEHIDTISIVRGWVLHYYAQPIPATPGEGAKVWISGNGSIATVPERTGTWQELFSSWAPSAIPLPAKIPQQTFEEAKTLGQAITCGPSGVNWEDIEAEEALCYMAPSGRIQIKLVCNRNPKLEWLDMPTTKVGLRAELKTMGLPAFLALHVCLSAALNAPKQIMQHGPGGPPLWSGRVRTDCRCEGGRRRA